MRLSEVTDLKWPHGTEWQYGNSTLAMSWPNHVQILSFASMVSRQGAVKHGFVSKIAGGCSFYDVIAPWPDLTWSIFVYQKLRKVCPIKNTAAPRFVGRSRNAQKKRQIPFDSWWCADSKNVIFIKIGRWPFSTFALLCPTRYFFSLAIWPSHPFTRRQAFSSPTG